MLRYNFSENIDNKNCMAVPETNQFAVDRWKRNEKEDLKDAIDALYEFKKKLDKLHPNCTDIISKLLSVNI